MGVDCIITLPKNVRLSNVVEVVGIAAGLKPQWNDFKHNDGGYVSVPGAEAKSSLIPEMAQISIKAKLSECLIDGEVEHFYNFHFEPDNESGRLLTPRSTAFWICVGKRLVDFFGGKVDFSDCDSKEVNYKKPAKSRNQNAPTDGKAYDSLQKRIMAVKPITEEELESAKKHAAY